MTWVILNFNREPRLGLEMDSVPRVGDYVRGQKVTRVDWDICRATYGDDPNTFIPTYQVEIDFEQEEEQA